MPLPNMHMISIGSRFYILRAQSPQNPSDHHRSPAFNEDFDSLLAGWLAVPLVYGGPSSRAVSM